MSEPQVAGYGIAGVVSRRSFLRASTAALLAVPAPLRAAATRHPVGYAVIGLGEFAGYVLPRLARCERSKLVALVSSDGARARRIAAEYGVSPRRVYDYEEFDRLAADTAVEAVYVCTPVGTHADFAVHAFAAGKHVLVEKTMASTPAEARSMIAAGRQAGRMLMVAYRARFDPYTQEAIRIARERDLGPVRAIFAHKGFTIGEALGKDGWRLQRRLAGGGALVDVGVYSVQAARYLAGEEPAEVSAVISNDPADPRFGEVEQHIAVQMRFPGGAVASCTASWGYVLQNHYRAVAPGGWFELEPATSNGNLRMRVSREQESAADRVLPQVDQIPIMFDHFSDCIRTGAEPITPAEEGLRDLEVIAAAYESAASGRSVRLAATPA